MSVSSMRGIGHDAAIRTFTIDGNPTRVGLPFRPVPHSLTGTPARVSPGGIERTRPPLDIGTGRSAQQHTVPPVVERITDARAVAAGLSRS